MTGQHLRAAEWCVREVSLREAQAMVREYHYAAGGSNTRTASHGLYRIGDERLMGVAWWIPPTRHAAASVWPRPDEVLSLTRLVVHPEVPTNGASFLLSRSRKLLPPRWRCLLTYADTLQGHTGAIYRADNWEYLGMTKPERVYVLNGRMVARKAGGRTRTKAEMLALGCEERVSLGKHKYRRVVA